MSSDKFPAYYVQLHYINQNSDDEKAVKEGFVWVKFRDEAHAEDASVDYYDELIHAKLLPVGWEVDDPESQLEPWGGQFEPPVGVSASDVIDMTSRSDSA
jgi:hypothetical protein